MNPGTILIIVGLSLFAINYSNYIEREKMEARIECISNKPQE